MATLTFDNATLSNYATVPLSKVDDGVKVGADGYPEFTINRNATCITSPVAYREDGVGLYPRG